MANWGEIAAMLQTLAQTAASTQETFDAQANRDTERAMQYYGEDQASNRNLMNQLIGAGTALGAPRAEAAAELWAEGKRLPGGGTRPNLLLDEDEEDEEEIRPPIG